MVDEDIPLLAVTVQTTVSLLHAGRVPRDVPVKHRAGGPLEIEALAGCIGGHENTGRAARVVEGLFDCVAVMIVHAAIHLQEPRAVAVLRPETGGDVFQRGEIFAEDHNPLVGPPLAATSELFIEERFESRQAGVCLDFGCTGDDLFGASRGVDFGGDVRHANRLNRPRDAGDWLSQLHFPLP